MLVKAVIPLDQLVPQKSSGEHPTPPLKRLVLVQCDRCQRLEVDTDA